MVLDAKVPVVPLRLAGESLVHTIWILYGDNGQSTLAFSREGRVESSPCAKHVRKWIVARAMNSTCQGEMKDRKTHKSNTLSSDGESVES
jgi:hypothetical protein